jgi:hypothetical protein
MSEKSFIPNDSWVLSAGRDALDFRIALFGAVAHVAGLVVVSEDLERVSATRSAGLEVASGHSVGWCPVAALAMYAPAAVAETLGSMWTACSWPGWRRPRSRQSAATREWMRACNAAMELASWILAEQTGHSQTLPQVSRPNDRLAVTVCQSVGLPGSASSRLARRGSA